MLYLKMGKVLFEKLRKLCMIVDCVMVCLMSEVCVFVV